MGLLSNKRTFNKSLIKTAKHKAHLIVAVSYLMHTKPSKHSTKCDLPAETGTVPSLPLQPLFLGDVSKRHLFLRKPFAFHQFFPC